MKRTLLFSEKNFTILFFLLTLILCTNLNAQTALISPTGDGGFENGTTFAANGWTAVNGGNNKWYTGTAVKTNGVYGAYIDRNANTGSTNEYNTNNGQINYIYKDLAIPAGATNINLNFKWRCVGENGTGDDEFDFIRVFLISDSTPIVAGTLLTAGSIGLVKYNSSNPTSFTTAAPINISNSVAGTTQRLAFCWNNDGSIGSNPAGAIDEISLTYTPAVVTSAPTISSLSATNGCVGGNITINGTNLTGATAAGVTIGGTAVSSITSNSGTVLVAIIGAGTTGTVSVTTPGGIATISGFTVNTLPAANAGSALAAICQGGTTAVLDGSFGGAATSAIWSTTSGGTFANNTGSTPGTSTWIPPAGFTGTATLVLTTAGGSCTAATASKTQVVNPLQTANSGSALAAICQGGTTAALVGSFGGGATSAIWSTTSGGTFANNTGSTPGTATWTPPTSFTGIATFVLTTAGGACTAATSSKTQIVNPLPTANAGSALAAICQGGTTSALVGSFGGAATSATWSTTSGGTFANNTGSTPGTATWTPPAGFTGTATLILTTAGGSCVPATASKNQVVNTPTASAGAALTAICQGGTSAVLGGSYAGGATSAVWSDGGVGGTFANNTGSTPNTATWTPPAGYTGTATLLLTTAGDTCGTTTASKNQVVNTGAFATVGSAQKIYASFTSTSLGGNAPGGTTGGWTKIFGPGTVTFSSNTSATATATVSVYGAYVFRWTLNSSCGATTADINVTYLPFKDPEHTISYENFDNSNGGWASSGTGSWGYTNTASSPHRGEGSFWAVNTTSNLYPNNALTYLTSPNISTSGYTNVKLFIDVRYKTEVNFDGMQIQYSTNNGGSWNVLGTSGSSWYTSNSISSLTNSLSNTSGWHSDSSLQGSPSIPAPAPFSQFIEKSIVTSVLDNIGSLRLRAVFTSDNGVQDSGVAIDNVIIKGDPIIPFAYPTSGPGSINSNLKLWLKSNTGTSTTADGTALSTWNDQAFNNNSVGITGNSPVFRNNATRNINFNPVVDFTAASSHVMKGKGGYWSQDYYVVIKTNGAIDNTTATRQVPISGRLSTSGFQSDGTALGLGNFTQRYNDEMVSHNVNSIPSTPPTDTQSYGRAYTSTTESYNQQTIIFNIKTNSSGTATEIYKNGKRIDNTTGQAVGPSPDFAFAGTLNFSNFNNLQYNLGVGRFTLGGNVGSYLDGRMTEVVSYSSPKSVIEQQKIQSYLAIKNGVTLHASGSTTTDDLCDANYLDSAGSTIWDAFTNSGYNYDIAGIGRDDNTLLNQKQSKTENPTADISMGLGDLLDVNTNNLNTFDTDKNFLVWGNNHGTLAAQPAVVVNISSGITSPSALITDVSFISVGRTWKVVETGGNVPTAKVSIPAAMLTATITPPGDYLMFISSTPNFDPTAEYRVMRENGANLETTYDFDGTKYITFGYAPEVTRIRCIKFNGTTDYMDAGKVLDLNSSFTVSAWINKNNNNFNKTILSKRNSSFTEGYDLGINATGRAEMSWYSGGTKKTITSNAIIPIGKWHHIGVTFNGTTAKIYVDGVNKISSNLSGIPSTTTENFLIAAANGTTPTSFFNGSIDEVRVWKSALTEAQFRFVMNQEILQDASKTSGALIPPSISKNDIGIVDWTQLNAYYPMTTYTYTNAKDKSSYGLTAALRNLKTVDLQTAPLPYESRDNGNWESAGSWLNNSLLNLPYSTSIEDPIVTTSPPAPPGLPVTIDWNIVRIKSNHTINSVGNKTVLGIFVETNANLTATSASGLQTDGSKLEVSHYLKLDGKIDLVGRSQLVQKLNSDLDPTSSGSLERDQQGQANKFNYNYWGSPVGEINITTNNNNFTVGGVLRDGTNPASPANINWIPGYNGSLTNPISLAGYWIYKFDSNVNAIDYANWTQIGETGILQAGKGFTLKGPGSSGTQNLTFVGKPNNGTITNTVGSDQLLLVGNPYPSALDADKFISDNINSIETSISNAAIDGALYFWEHYPSNTSHNLGAYLGGYGIRNLAGGVSPSSVGVDYINTTGISLRAEPKRYIPVGQGFFVIGKIGSGGTVTFNNTQREFIKENELTLSQTTYRIPKTPKDLNHWTDNSNTAIEIDTHKRVRLGFNFYNQSFHRQVLLAFMDEKANSEMNDGYDAFNIDDSPSDMYLLNGENELAIQGEGYFDEEASFPIGVRSETTGKISFVLDGLENFDESQNIFIHDNETDTYHSIKDKAYEVEIPEGTFNERFSLRFIDKSLAVQDPLYENAITVFFTRSNNVLNIKNSANDNTVLSASLYNIQGRLISKWDVEEKDQSNIKIPIQDKTSAVYIVKLKTAKGTISKKIIVK